MPEQLRMMLIALVGFLALVGALAMLIKVPYGTGFSVSGSVIPNPILVSPLPISGVGHVASGSNKSEYVIHVSKTGGLVEPTGLGFHEYYAVRQTRYVPADWIHNSIPGSGDTSGGSSATTQYVPPTAQHLDVGKDKTIYYDPGTFKHASVPGPDYSKLVLKDYEHVGISVVKEYTLYKPPNSPLHMASGPDATKVGPVTHLIGGPEDTKYVITRTGYNTHIESGTGKSKYVPPSWHDTRLFRKSNLHPNLAHLTQGEDTTKIADAVDHITSGADESKFKPRPAAPSTGGSGTTPSGGSTV